MQRCLELAELGLGKVSPNPMVGAVLVHENRIIGEGYHQEYGKSHAEVNCLASVAAHDKDLIGASALYVSLEPCAHFGKTPPCADLIIRHKIPRVVIGCRDPFKEVDGKGIEKLLSAGIEVVPGILEEECIALNKRFFIFHTQQRPYIILKWAQTKDGMMGKPEQRLLISNEYTNRLVHKWRSDESAILVGTNTALSDNPQLTNRFWQGPSPVRLVIDINLRLPQNLELFNGKVRTIVFNSVMEKEYNGIHYYRLDKNEDTIPQIVKALYKLNIQSVLVEGGAKTLQSFISAGWWDEARIITSQKESGVEANEYTGIAAPTLMNMCQVNELRSGDDTIKTFTHDNGELVASRFARTCK